MKRTEITEKNIKRVCNETLYEEYALFDAMMKEMKKKEQMFKDEIIRRNENGGLKYPTKDKLHTVTFNIAKGTKSLDTAKAKQLIPDWETTCYKVSADSRRVQVNDLKIK